MSKKELYIPDEIKLQLGATDDSAFDAVMALSGKAFRDVPGRKTVQVTLGGKSYFVKQHFGVGWGEIFKNLLVFKKPILGAMTEVAAIQKLNALDILTTPLVAYGQRGKNPAAIQSFVMTEDLGDICSLEELAVEWQEKQPKKAFKDDLIRAVASLAAKFHGAGLCHRDFYLCHFVLKKSALSNGQIQLHLIDLHRVSQSQPSNGKAVMKDMAGLYFSAMDYLSVINSELVIEDIDLFKQHYLAQSDDFWHQVKKRANKLYVKFNSNKFQQKLSAERSRLD